MRTYNILVTGVGAIIGYGIIKSLRETNYNLNIIGMDIYPDAIGQKWCDTFVQAIPAKEAGYCDFIADIMETYNIDLVMFGTEQEIKRLSEYREQFKGDIKKLVLNKEELVNLSQDKWNTYKFLEESGIQAIDSMIECSYEEAKAKWGTPFLLKPRTSYASKGIVMIENKKEFEFWKEKNGDNFMVQEIIGDNDHEYTVGIFGFGDGTYSQSITFQRKLSQEGATAKATVVDIEELNQEIERLTKIFKPIGPTNYQFRLHNSQYMLLEINPRISSSTSIRTAFGYNEAKMCIEFFVNNKKPEITQLKKGSAIRYISDAITYL